MNCPYCNKALEIKPNGVICWAMENHIFIRLNNRDETFLVKMGDMQASVFKERNIFIFNLLQDEEYNISEIRYNEVFNCKSKDDLNNWFNKANKEIVFK